MSLQVLCRDLRYQDRGIVRSALQGRSHLLYQLPDHPTSKPVALVEAMVKNSSRSGDVVLDGFPGSGSTIIACERAGRRCFGLEIDPRYVDVAVRRWETYTGQKAERAS